MVKLLSSPEPAPMLVSEAAPPLLSAIVVNWNTKEVLRGCLASLRQHLRGLDHETIVVDNGSSDGSPEMVEQDFPEVRLIRSPENLGFGRGNNLGMAAARGDLFLLVNSDARLLDDSAARLVDTLRQRSDVGVIAPRLVLEDGRLQASARRFPSVRFLLLTELWLHRLLPRKRAAEILLGHYWDHSEERAVDWLVGACLLVRRKVFEDTKGFDPEMFVYGEEVEWCWRIRKRGWTILFSPTGQVLHLDHRSADILLGTEGRIDRCLEAEDRLLRRWGGVTGALAPLVRMTGALLRVAVFGVHRVLHPGDTYARDVLWDARATIGHYLRRLRGRVAATAAVPCRLCGGQTAPLGDRGDVSLHQCRACAFVTGRPARSEAPEERYEGYYDGAVPPAPEARYEEWLARAEAELGRGRLLEVGAGSGGLVRVALRRGWRVDATEVSRSGLELLCATGARVFAGDLEAAGYPDGSFDQVVSLEVLEHLPAPLAHLRETWRILRPGGLLLLTTPNFGGLSRRWLGLRWRVVDPEHLGYFTPRTLRRALRDSGYRTAEISARSLDLTAWRRGSAGRFDAERSARLRDTVNASILLRSAKDAANVLLAMTGLGDSLLVWARK